VLRIVTSPNPEVAAHLEAVAYKRLEVRATTAGTYTELLATIRAAQPQIVITDVVLAGGSGFDLCTAIKRDPRLADVRVVLVIDAPVDRVDLDRLAACGAADLIALPLHYDEFYQHLAHMAGLPVRRAPRVDATVKLFAGERGQPLPGRLENLSIAGAGVRVSGPVQSGQTILLRLTDEHGDYPDIEATVVWFRLASMRDVLCGVKFVRVPAETQRKLEALCWYKVVPLPEGGATVLLQGDLSQSTEFDLLRQALEPYGQIELDMAAVGHVNSPGMAGWVRFLAGLEGKVYSFRRCSMAFAMQASRVSRPFGTGMVLSIDAAYVCMACHKEELRLIEAKAVFRDDAEILAPTFRCTECGGRLEFDDVPDRCLSFLRDAPRRTLRLVGVPALGG
jgi:CheY-like chemotaxis protein